MLKEINAIALLVASISLSGCFEPETNLSGLSEDTYKSSGVNALPMTFPAGNETISKARADFKVMSPPTSFQQPSTWVVYLAAPAWTAGGTKITRRVASDGAHASIVKNFLRANRLSDRVKLVWLQYDPNPSQELMGDKPVSKGNIIPQLLQPFGPDVDYYVHSPAKRADDGATNMRFDEWIKPYLSFVHREGDVFVTDNQFHLDQGFSDVNSEYWDNWSRIWFVVNPEGIVVDAYVSNLGTGLTYGANRPINSLIHHLSLDSESLHIPEIVEHNYISKYTPPYWDMILEESLDLFLNPDGV